MTREQFDNDLLAEDFDDLATEDFDAAEDFDEGFEYDEAAEDDDDEAFEDFVEDDDDEGALEDDDEAFEDFAEDDDDEAFDELAEDDDDEAFEDDDDEAFEDFAEDDDDESDDDESLGEDAAERRYRRRRSRWRRRMRAQRRRALIARRRRLARARRAARLRAVRARRAQQRLRRRIRHIRSGGKARVHRAPKATSPGMVRARLPNGATTLLKISPTPASLSALNKLRAVMNANDTKQAKASAAHSKAIAKLRSSLAVASKRLTAQQVKNDKAFINRVTNAEKKLDTRIRKEVTARKVADRKTQVRMKKALRRERLRSLIDTLSVGTALPVFSAKWDTSQAGWEGTNLALVGTLFGSILVGWGGSKLLGDSPWAIAPKALPIAASLVAGGLIDTPVRGTQLKTATIAIGQTSVEVDITGVTSTNTTVYVLTPTSGLSTPDYKEGKVTFSRTGADTSTAIDITYLVTINS